MDDMNRKDPRSEGGKPSSMMNKVRAAGAKVKNAVARHPISPLLYVVVLALAAGVIIFRSTYVKAYAVMIDGVEVGVVTDTNAVATAIATAEFRVGDVLSEDYDCGADITFAEVYSTQEELTDAQVFEDYIYEAADATMEAYVLYVDGEEIGMAPSQQAIDDLLYRVAEPYMTDNTVDYGFVEPITVTPVEVPSNTEFDLEVMLGALTVHTVEEAFYTVVKGDTFSKISKALDMSIEELSALNPDVNINKLSIGQNLVIQQSVPYLSVYTVDNLTYEEVIDSPIVYTETDTMYEGNTKVTEKGEDGLARVNANVTYVNGYESSREVVVSTTLVEPTTTYALKGTAPRPKTASKGYYITPVASYKITSKYGWRTLNGKREFHTGVDFAAGYGTSIRAADGGKVTYAGWKGNYGKLVIITHDDGSQTYYAHNSSILVSKGDKVYQGQTIAKMGSTGRSTGNHCHFEIRINGKTVNPLNYL